MREINWEKIKETKSPKSPFSIAVGLYAAVMGLGAVAAVSVRVYDSYQVHKQSPDQALDIDRSTPDIDIAPMP